VKIAIEIEKIGYLTLEDKTFYQHVRSRVFKLKAQKCCCDCCL